MPSYECKASKQGRLVAPSSGRCDRGVAWKPPPITSVSKSKYYVQAVNAILTLHLAFCALMIGPDPFLFTASAQLAFFALSQSVPALSPYWTFAVAGGLSSYGGDVRDQFRTVGVYKRCVGRSEVPNSAALDTATVGTLCALFFSGNRDIFQQKQRDYCWKAGNCYEALGT